MWVPWVSPKAIQYRFKIYMYICYLEIHLDLQKSCKDCVEFLYAPYSTSTIVNILYYHGTFVKAKKLTLVYYYYYLNSRLYSDFTSFSIDVYFLFQDPSQSTTLHLVVRSPLSSLVWQFLDQSFLVFHDLDNLEDYWPDIMWNGSQSEFDVFLMIRLGAWAFWKNTALLITHLT